MATPTTLPATFAAGDVLTAAQQNALRGAFRILQVVEGSTTTTVSSSTTAFVDTTLTATITPSFTTSKILVLVTQSGCSKTATDSGSALQIKLLRGATDLYAVNNNMFTGSAVANYGTPISMTILDSPATTSATIYKTQFANRVNAASVTCQDGFRSSILLLEVSA
jgi:hypothetical protein